MPPPRGRILRVLRSSLLRRTILVAVAAGAALMFWREYADVAIVSGQTAASEEHDVRVVVLTRGLQHPWGLAFLPDGR